MEIYVVTIDNYDGDSFLDVFATRAEAKEFIEFKSKDLGANEDLFYIIKKRI